MKGWVGLVGWLAADGLPHKWSPVSCRSSTGENSPAKTDILPLCYATNPDQSLLLANKQSNTAVGEMQSSMHLTPAQVDNLLSPQAWLTVQNTQTLGEISLLACNSLWPLWSTYFTEFYIVRPTWLIVHLAPTNVWMELRWAVNK